MATVNKAEKFEAVQALRFICFFVVFGVHAKFINAITPAMVLEVFIVLSGFMMTYFSKNKELSINPIASFKYSCKKIGKLYPLHILTTVIQLCFLFWYWPAMNTPLDFSFIAPAFASHVTLLHAWVANQSINFLFNGPSWYLSVSLFLYFMFPLVLKLIKKIKSGKCLILLGVGTLLVMYFAVFFSYKYGSNEFFTWVAVHCPVIKLGDFFVGCIMGKLYADWREKQTAEPVAGIGFRIKWTVIEFVAIAIGAFGLEMWMHFGANASFGLYDNTCFGMSVGFNLVAVLLVFVFVMNRGYITKILSNKVLIFLGDISAFTYLTHYVFTILWTDIVDVFKIDNSGWIKFTAVVTELALTILTGWLWSVMMKKLALKKKMKQQAAA